jgi:hypothetical protein
LSGAVRVNFSCLTFQCAGISPIQSTPESFIWTFGSSRMLKKAEQMVNVICQALCKPLIYIIREITGNPISAAC